TSGRSSNGSNKHMCTICNKPFSSGSALQVSSNPGQCLPRSLTDVTFSLSDPHENAHRRQAIPVLDLRPSVHHQGQSEGRFHPSIPRSVLPFTDPPIPGTHG